jgi:hypothetical protein
MPGERAIDMPSGRHKSILMSVNALGDHEHINTTTRTHAMHH